MKSSSSEGKENKFFEQVLIVQINENKRQRLLARLCSRSDGWNQFMLCKFTKTINFSLEQYQQYADNINEHTNFIQINCKILINSYKKVIDLISFPLKYNSEEINIIKILLDNTKQILDLSVTQYAEQSKVIDSLKYMIKHLNES